MKSTLSSQETLHGIGVSQLPAASAAGLSIPQGMRQGGGTRGTIRSAAHFPSKAALELGRKIRFARRRIGDRVSMTTFSKSQGSVLDVESPVASNLIEPCRKASGQRYIVIGRKLALPDRSVKADSHRSDLFALRPLQGECGREGRQGVGKRIPILGNRFQAGE